MTALHRLLTSLHARFGDALFSDQRLCRSVLLDHAASVEKKRINVLVGAVAVGVPARILGESAVEPWMARRQRLAGIINDELGLDAELAAWAVEQWAVALGRATLPAEAMPTALSGVGAAVMPPTVPAWSGKSSAETNACTIAVTLKRVETDEDEEDEEDEEDGDVFATLHFEVHNATLLNWSSLSLELVAYDKDGYNVGETSFGGRYRAGSKMRFEWMIDCPASSIADIELIEVCETSQIGGKYMVDASDDDQQLLAQTVLAVNSQAAGITFSAPSVPLIDFAR